MRFNEHYYITESGEATTVMEQVIVDVYNVYNEVGGDEKKFKKNIVQQDGVKKFFDSGLAKSSKLILPSWRGEQTKGGTWKRKSEVNTGLSKDTLSDLYTFGVVLSKKIGKNGRGDAGAGQGKPQLSEFWFKTTGKKNDTSKTDIIMNKKKVSVKAQSAQLMSAKKEESQATVETAIELSDVKKNMGKKLTTLVENFTDIVRTEGASMTTGELSKTPMKSLSTLNKKAKKIYNAADVVSKDTMELMETMMNDSEDFGYYFALEAMTGYEKFGGNAFGKPGDTDGEATAMLVFSEDLTQIKWHSDLMGKSGKKYITDVSNSMNIQVNMKSTSYKQKGKKMGYSFYQNVRAAIHTVFEDFQHESNMLSETSVQDITKNTLIKLKQLWDKFVSKMMDFIKMIKDAFAGGIRAISEFFGFEYYTIGDGIGNEVNLLTDAGEDLGGLD